MQARNRHRCRFLSLVLITLFLCAIASLFHVPALGQEAEVRSDSSYLASAESSFPAPQPHPLPAFLAAWQDSGHQGDYFDQIDPTSVGYLIWSDFPVRVYLAPSTETERFPWQVSQAQAWTEAVIQAVEEWQPYFPLQLTEQSEDAHITIWRRTPPLQRESIREFRSRSAETQYTLYRQRFSNGSPPILTHRCSISIRPGQSAAYIQAAARHELGHALGIWGHSPHPADALYFAQVRNPAPISVRDLNTLKRIYQQPTRLGWPMG